MTDFDKAAKAIDEFMQSVEHIQWLNSIPEFVAMTHDYQRCRELLKRAWMVMGIDGKHTLLEQEIAAYLSGQEGG